MPNKYVNKVVIGKETKLDLTADTITPDKLAKGITAHDKSGAPITGTSTKDADTSLLQYLYAACRYQFNPGRGENREQHHGEFRYDQPDKGERDKCFGVYTANNRHQVHTADR